MHALMLTALCALPVAAASGQVVFDEATDGDLSTDPLAPTGLDLNVGSNIVSGTVTNQGDTRDFFTFEIGAGESLTGIFLLDYTDVDSGGNGDRGFIHIDEGNTSVVPSGGTAGEFLGGSHLDRGLIPDENFNVLERLAGAPQGGTGFTAPLGPGTYTINVQQTGPELTAYALDLVVVPAPGSLAVLGLGGLAAVRRRR